MSSGRLSYWEVWAVAAETIRRHGENAGRFAAGRIAVFDDLGDAKGMQAWEAILGRIIELELPTAPGTVH